MTGEAPPAPAPSRAEPARAEQPRPERDIARELRLRPEPPSVTRISRKVLLIAGAVVAVAVSGAAIYALRPQHKSGPAEELISTDHRTAADGLATLPRDYTGLPRNVPQLGPPLPGDLGRPIVAAQNNSQPVPVSQAGTAPGAAPVDPAVQRREEQQLRRAQEREAAQLSKLFAGTAVTEASAALQPGADASTLAPPSGVTAPTLAAQETGSSAIAQDHKLAFVSAAADKRTTSPDRIEAPASPYIVQAGTTIMASDRGFAKARRTGRPTGLPLEQPTAARFAPAPERDAPPSETE